MLSNLSEGDIRLLKVFVKVVEAGGFSAAQIDLNISQSTISTHMTSLEQRLGMRLCERGRSQRRHLDAKSGQTSAAGEFYRHVYLVIVGGLEGKDLQLGDPQIWCHTRCCAGRFNSDELNSALARVNVSRGAG